MCMYVCVRVYYELLSSAHVQEYFAHHFCINRSFKTHAHTNTFLFLPQKVMCVVLCYVCLCLIRQQQQEQYQPADAGKSGEVE